MANVRDVFYAALSAQRQLLDQQTLLNEARAKVETLSASVVLLERTLGEKLTELENASTPRTGLRIVPSFRTSDGETWTIKKTANGPRRLMREENPVVHVDTAAGLADNATLTVVDVGELERVLALLYNMDFDTPHRDLRPPYHAVAKLCTVDLDPSGGLLDRVRDLAQKLRNGKDPAVV